MNLEPFYENVARRRLRQKRNKKYVGIGVLLFIFAVSLFVTGYERKELAKCHGPGLSVEQLKYQAYFHKAGAGKDSLEIANAVMQSKRPAIAAKVCVVESNGKKTAINKQSKAKGLFGVKEKYWGKVNTKSTLAMVNQHDKIMDDLLRECEGDLVKTLNYYGGDKSKKVYAKNILSELEFFDK